MKKENIIESGEKAIVVLDGGDTNESLSTFHFRQYSKKVLKRSKYVEACDLPPSAASAKFHNLRVYYQIRDWRGMAATLDPLEWGWEMVGQMLLPVKCDMPPAPDNLLHSFCCQCKTGCDSKKCTCRKHELDSTIACSECKGVSCSNSSKPLEEMDTED